MVANSYDGEKSKEILEQKKVKTKGIKHNNISYWYKL